MKRRTLIATAILAGCAVLGAGCQTVTINPADGSPPVVEVLVKQPDGQYAVASEAKLASGGQVKLLCRVRDAQGVKQAKLTFQGGTSDTCTVGSAVFSGAFPLHPPPPSAMVQDISGSNGKAPTVVPLFADVNDARCTVFGQSQDGRPLGHDIVATCTGTNWSSNAGNHQATATLTITFQ